MHNVDNVFLSVLRCGCLYSTVWVFYFPSCLYPAKFNMLIYFQSGRNPPCKSVNIDFVLMLDGSQHMGRHEFEVRFLTQISAKSWCYSKCVPINRGFEYEV